MLSASHKPVKIGFFLAAAEAPGGAAPAGAVASAVACATDTELPPRPEVVAAEFCAASELP